MSSFRTTVEKKCVPEKTLALNFTSPGGLVNAISVDLGGLSDS
jgi:hypothetical protein